MSYANQKYLVRSDLLPDNINICSERNDFFPDIYSDIAAGTAKLGVPSEWFDSGADRFERPFRRARIFWPQEFIQPCQVVQRILRPRDVVQLSIYRRFWRRNVFARFQAV